MENNLPQQLSACDILKATNEHDASRNVRVSFNDEIVTRNISDTDDVNKSEDYQNTSCLTARKEETTNVNAGLKEDKSSVNVISSEYGFRASSMRGRIEEKISVIEEKINLAHMNSSSESLETETSSLNYDVIKGMDARRLRSCSLSEMRQSTIDRLQSNLDKAEKDLQLREEEVQRLRKIRDEVGSEIEDLTASLFEEANNMVKNANMKQAKAENNAKEANMKLSMLEEEVRTLKNIVQTISAPNLEGNDVALKKGVLQRETYEVDPIFHQEFVTWRQNPIFNKECPFFKRIYEEDIYPCLNFKNSEVCTLHALKCYKC